MTALELSSLEEVREQIGTPTDLSPTERAVDEKRLQRALDSAREWITGEVRPRADLPDPLPASLHEATTLLAVRWWGIWGTESTSDLEAPPVSGAIRRLLDRWRPGNISSYRPPDGDD